MPIPNPQPNVSLLRLAGVLPLWENEPGPASTPLATQPVPITLAPPVPPRTRPFPWQVDVPSQLPGGAPATVISDRVATIGPSPIAPGMERVTAPEGTADFMRGTPSQLAEWLTQVRKRQSEEEAAAMRRAEVTGTLQVREEFARKQQEAMQQSAIQDELRRISSEYGPVAYLSAVASLTKAQQPQTKAMPPEAQVTAELLRLDDLPQAISFLQSLKQRGTAGTQPRTPEDVYNRVLAETMARFGPEAQELRATTAEKTAVASAVGRQTPDIPLTLTEAQKFGVPLGTTRGQLEGQLLSSPTQREKVQELNTGMVLLEQLDDMTKRLIKAESPAQAFPQGLRLTMAAQLGSDPVARAYRDQVGAFSGILSRLVAMERGVLTEGDIRRIQTGLPTFFDTREVRDRKLGLMRLLLSTSQTARRAAITALVGPPPGGVWPTETGGAPSTTPAQPGWRIVR